MARILRISFVPLASTLLVLIFPLDVFTAQTSKLGFLLDSNNYGRNEWQCLEAAFKLALSDARMEGSMGLFSWDRREFPNQLFRSISGSADPVQKFRDQYHLGIRNFIGPSSEWIQPVLREIREFPSRYRGIGLYQVEPQFSAVLQNQSEVSVKEFVPKKADFLDALLAKLCQFQKSISGEVVVSILPIFSSPVSAPDTLDVWHEAIAKSGLQQLLGVEVFEPLSLGVDRELFTNICKRVVEDGNELNIVILDGHQTTTSVLQVLHASGSLQMPSLIHLHVPQGMNQESMFSNLLEAKANVMLHVAEYLTSDWHLPVRRRLYGRLREILRQHSEEPGRCPPSANLIYRIAVTALRSELVPSAPWGQIIQAFYQQKNVTLKEEPLVAIMQESPWIWDGPTQLCHAAEPTKPSLGGASEMISKPSLEQLVRAKLGVGCRSPQITLSSYDPWHYHLVQRTYPVQRLPYVIMLANIGGFWIDASCWNGSHLLNYSMVCSTNVHATNASDGLVTDTSGNHCSDRILQKELIEYPDLPSKDTDDEWDRQQAELVKLFKPIANTSVGLKRRKRSDLYGPAWIYEILNRSPGQLTSVIVETSPAWMGCFGLNLGCMTCVFVRATTDFSPIPGCLAPCVANIANGCGNAWGSFLAKELSAKSVVCTELFKQGFIDSETFLADGQFGAYLETRDPLVLEGYRLLASPVVAAARRSSLVAKALYYITAPLMEYFKEEQGFSVSNSRLSSAGWLAAELSKPLFRVVGFVSENVPNYLRSMSVF